jgi:hypothetical protein
MAEITVSLDEQIVTRATQIAHERGANLQTLIREFVVELANQNESTSPQAIDNLEQTFAQLSRPMGGVDWKSREELHER